MRFALLSILLFLSINVFAQKEYYPESKSQLKKWLKEANQAKEINKQTSKRIYEILEEMGDSSDDANEIYNFGRAIADALQPGFKLQNHSFSQGALQLMIQAELAYRHSIAYCECHGRANIMLGLLYNQQKKYTFSEPFLEKGLKLEEGSDDWMIAANQYILAGAYTNKTKTTKYQNIYKKFKVLAPKHNNRYYNKMAMMYIPYYE